MTTPSAPFASPSQLDDSPRWGELALKTGLAWAILTQLISTLLTDLLFLQRGLIGPGQPFDLNTVAALIPHPNLDLVADFALGALAGVFLYLARRPIFRRASLLPGALIAFGVLAAFSLLVTLGPAVMMQLELNGVLSIFLQFILQDVLIALLVVYWVRPPRKVWLDWLMGGLFALLVLIPLVRILRGLFA